MSLVYNEWIHVNGLTQAGNISAVLWQHLFIHLFHFSGEAGVPFFHASGSEFDEIFVGTGAKRVRQLFSKYMYMYNAKAVLLYDLST